MRRTENDQMRGIPQSLFDQGSELSRTGEFVTVSEDRIQAVRNRSVEPVFPNQISWYAKVFQFSSQPSRSFFVLVGVGYESQVFVGRTHLLNPQLQPLIHL